MDRRTGPATSLMRCFCPVRTSSTTPVMCLAASRSLDLAALTDASGDGATAATHLRDARHLLDALGLSRYLQLNPVPRELVEQQQTSENPGA